MGQKIIVVDDDPLVGDLSSYLLTEAGYDVQVVQDSTKAIEAIKSFKPVLAILDILMPGIDGLTLCRQIKTDPELKDMKIANFDKRSNFGMREGGIGSINQPLEISRRNIINKPGDNLEGQLLVR